VNNNNQITADVTVIIPAYNMEKFIGKSLDSVKAQTRLPKELIIVNDGSTDSTLAIIKKWISSHEKILNVTLINKTNGGLSSARNTGIKACKTKLFALLDADDCYAATFIEKAEQAFSAEEDLALFFANQRVVDEEGNKLFDWLETKNIVNLATKCLHNDILLLTEPVIPSLINGNYISCSASVFNKQKLTDQNGYNEAIKAGEDTEFLIRNLSDKKIAFTFEELAIVLRHSNSITQSKRHLVHVGRICALDMHRQLLLQHNVTVNKVIKEQFSHCYYQLSLLGCKPLFEFYLFAQKNISLKESPSVKDWFRALKVSFGKLLLSK